MFAKFFLALFFGGILNAQELAICSIFQNEACHLKEWIEFHHLVGVDQFYLYDNNSTDNFKEVLQPYIEKGWVFLCDWSKDHDSIEQWNEIQVSAYNDCLERNRNKIKWIAFIDLDEWIVPVQKDNIKKILKDYEDFSGVGINWQIYGTSNYPKIGEKELLIEKLRWKAPTNHLWNHTCKSIVKAADASHFVNPHWAFYRKGYQVNTKKERYSTYKTDRVYIDKIRLNHYISGDLYKLYNVKYPRMCKWNPYYKIEELLQYDQICNSEEDFIMRKFIKRLKVAMYNKLKLNIEK